MHAGIGGAGVLDTLTPAFQDQLRRAKDAGKPFNYVVTLFGVNDVIK